MTEPRSVTPASRRGISTFLSTAMIVGGIGTAWPGLLLAAAGAVLGIIDLREFERRNPWLFPRGGNPDESPLFSPAVLRLSRWAMVSIALCSGLALGLVTMTGERIVVLAPAILAGVIGVLQDRRLIRALQASASAER